MIICLIVMTNQMMTFETLNTEDGQTMIISTEWQEEDIKIVAIREGMHPVKGQVNEQLIFILFISSRNRL